MLLFTFAGQSEWIVLFLFGGTQWKNKKSKSLRSCQWSCQRRSSWTTPLKPCRNLYEPMSVSHILRLGQKESRWTPQPESSGIRFYRSFNSLARYLVEDHVRIILLCKSKNFVYIISGLIICFHSSRRIIIDTIIILQAFTSKNALVKVQIIAKLFPCNQIAISSPAPIYIAIHCVLPCRIKSILSVEQSSHKTVFAKVPAMGQIWRDFGHAFSFASSSSRGMYPSPSYLIWMCCTRFPLDLSGAST